LESGAWSILLFTSASQATASFRPAWAAKCNGDCFLAFRTLMSAVLVMRSSQTWRVGAKKSGVWPCRSGTLGSACASNSDLAHSMLPSNTAMCKALTPRWSFALVSAPLLNNNCNRGRWCA